MRLEARVRRVALRAPVSAAHGTISDRELVLVTISGGGETGHGEAAPLASYDGVAIADVLDALADCRATLASFDGDERSTAGVLAECRARAVLPQAIAAIDLALWDLAGRRAGAPVWRLLGAAAPEPQPVNATIAAPDRAGAAGAAAAARRAGFSTIKVKVGLGDDPARVAAIRAAAGHEMAIRLDANGAWTPEEAVAHLGVLRAAGIELCEEPVHGLDDFDQLRALGVPVPIALDESAILPGALAARHADAACLKISSGGGISGVIEQARAARAAGYEVYLASTLDGPLGIAAALHAAAVIGPERPCGLATLALFEGEDPLPPRAGRIAAPTAPGLGVSPDFGEWR